MNRRTNQALTDTTISKLGKSTDRCVVTSSLIFFLPEMGGVVGQKRAVNVNDPWSLCCAADRELKEGHATGH